MNKKQIIRMKKPLLLFLLLSPIFVFGSSYFLFGPYWDVIAHHLDGRTLSNLVNGKINPLVVLTGEHGNNLSYYFESYRAPVSYLIFAILNPVFKNFLFPYYIILYLILLIGILVLSKELKINRNLLIILFLGPAIIFYWFMGNSEEALGIGFALLAIAYLIKDKPNSGIFFGLSVLGKFPSLILLPMIFLLTTRLKITKAILLEILTLLPLLLFSFVLYGNPISIFLLSFSASTSSQIPTAIYLNSLANIFGYILLIYFVVALFVVLVQKKKVRNLNLRLGFKNRTERIITVLLILALIDFLLTGLYHDSFTQTRYGYLLTFASIIAVSYSLNDSVKSSERLQLILVSIGIIIFLGFSIFMFYNLDTHQVYYYNPSNPISIYQNASNVLERMGYQGCRIVSNAWIPFLYANVNAYSPFSLPEYYKQYGYKPSNSSMDNGDYYPIVIFKQIGVSPSLILDANSSMIVYNNSAFMILLPRNAICYAN